MKITIPVLSAALLSACAMPYEEQRAHASSSSNDYLCMKVVTRPEHRQAAEDELRARGASCDWGKVQAMIAGQGARSGPPPTYQLPVPSPQPLPRTVNCTSREWIRGTVQTTCQ